MNGCLKIWSENLHQLHDHDVQILKNNNLYSFSKVTCHISIKVLLLSKVRNLIILYGSEIKIHEKNKN
jgi:hypothetical protein